MIGAFIARLGEPPDAATLLSTFGHVPGRRPRKLMQAERALVALSPAGGPAGAALAREGDCMVAFDGWLANRAEMRAALALPATASDATICLRAVTTWGPAAFGRLDGHFACIASTAGERQILLARSGIRAPPLHFGMERGRLIVSSLPRSLELLGPIAFDSLRVAAMLAGDTTPDFRSTVAGRWRVPLGTACQVRTDADRPREVWRHRFCIPDGNHVLDDRQVVEGALTRLAAGVCAATEGSRSPSISISGGLDSALVAAVLMEQRPELPLHGFTYAPEPGWEDPPGSPYFGDEAAAVAEFASLHPRMVSHVVRSEGEDFRDGLDRRIELAAAAPQVIGFAGELHACVRRAAALGCDVMLGGDEGNCGISASGEWAYGEFLRTGRWRELAAMLPRRPGDPRPTWRRMMALLVGDRTPGRRPHDAVPQAYYAVLGLNPVTAREAGLDHSPGLAAARARIRVHSTPRQMAHIMESTDDCGHADMLKAIEADTGIAYRDPTATRSVLEFCFSLPSDQFVRGGQRRYLARRMAHGRLPEAQRREMRHGKTQADWKLRMVRASPELAAELDAMRGDEEIGRVLDIDALADGLARLSASPDMTSEEELLVVRGIPSAIAFGRAVARNTRRNRF